MTAEAGVGNGSPRPDDPGLTDWGWNDGWAAVWDEVAPELAHDAGAAPAVAAVGVSQPARVLRTDRGEATVATASGELRCTMTTRAADVVAGDWTGVDVDAARVDIVLPRRTSFVRRAARGALRQQALAANIDVVAVCHGLDRDVNSQRIERELVAAFDSGAAPVVVLTKADLDPARAERQAAALVDDLIDVPVVAVRTDMGTVGIKPLAALVGRHSTVALIGASGVGKSSLANTWLGHDRQSVGEVRRGDRKGRHTTTAAELLALPDGRLLLDTPGIRALALWATPNGIDATFPEIASAAAHCGFSDCSHTHEPGCAVLAAVDAGDISDRRADHYRRLVDELNDLDDELTRRDWR